VLLKEFLGISFLVKRTENPNIVLQNGSKTLTISDYFFRASEKNWLVERSLPQLPLKNWNVAKSGLDVNLVDMTIPVIFGQPGFDVDEKGNGYLNLDIFGSAFFMLSRYEEIVRKERDEHDRFSASASLAYQAGFLGRPIINEYLEILWACMKYLWHDLKRRSREFRMLVSCDVDIPYSYGLKNPLRQVKQIGGDIFKRHDPIRALKNVINYYLTKKENYSFDPFFPLIEWIMDVNEVAGNRVAFYFMPGPTYPASNPNYSLNEPIIKKLLHHIYERGHEIGLHPSYNTYKNKALLCRESAELRKAMEENGIQQDILGGRQHFLRWETPTTARILEEAGLDYDSTLSFADHAGFRCGVCYEYPMYDLKERKALSIHQRPLILMECTLLFSKYCSVNNEEEILKKFNELLHRTKMFQGDFTLLWHNSFFEMKWHRDCYRSMILSAR
jgi:hypothetical protein